LKLTKTRKDKIHIARTIINIQHFEITCFSGFLIRVMSDTYVYHVSPIGLPVKSVTSFFNAQVTLN